MDGWIAVHKFVRQLAHVSGRRGESSREGILLLHVKTQYTKPSCVEYMAFG